jgi:hypothetical protein
MKLLGFDISRGKKKAEIKSVARAAIDDITKQWEFSDDRKTIYDDIDRMATSDEYVAEALDCLVSDTIPVKNWYESDFIEVESEDEGLKKRVLDILYRSDLKEQIRNICHGFLRYGNAHSEYLVNGASFERIKYIPQAWSVYRNIDIHGELMNGDPGLKKVKVCAYDQRDDTGGFLAGFWPYQIIHWKSIPLDIDGNGIPFLQAARHNWLKMQYVEDALRRARIERAYSKLAHLIPVATNATNEEIEKVIAEYIKSISYKKLTSLADSALSKSFVASPKDVSTDFYLPVNEQMKGDIKVLDPSNPQLQNLADMDYFLNRLFARLKVPKARLANEADVRAKATMGEINTAYAATITGYQIDLLIGIYEMVNRTLFLEGVISDIDERLQYKLILPSAFVKDEQTRAEIEDLESRAASNYIKAGVLSRDRVRQDYLSMDEDESAEEEQRVLGEKDVFPEPQPMGGLFAGQVKPDEEVLKELYALRKEVNDNGDKDSHSRIINRR